MTQTFVRGISLMLLHAMLLDQAVAYTSNCTLPPVGTHYVGNPPIRGTLSILWSALSIIILCTWNIQHLNVPGLRGPHKGFRQKLWWKIMDSGRKLKWMLFTVFMPEFIMGKAINELLLANACFEQDALSLKEHCTRTYLANMGYFVLDWGCSFDDNTLEQGTEHTEKTEKRENTETTMSTENDNDLAGTLTTLRSYINTIWIDPSHSLERRINMSRLKHRYWALTAWQWQIVEKWGVASLPDNNEWRLKKLDAGGELIKLLALFQILWLFLQLIVRQLQSLPSSQLEIFTLAFAVNSAVTYCLYWDRPQNIESVHIIKANAPKLNQYPRNRLKDFACEVADQGPRYFWLSFRTTPSFNSQFGPAPLPNDGAPMRSLFDREAEGRSDERSRALTGMYLGGTLFGGLHLLAWRSHFPTPGEALAWKICGLLLTVLPILLFHPSIPWLMDRSQTNTIPGNKVTRKSIIAMLIAIIYMLARLYMVVETARTLFYLPTDVFKDTWTDSVLHYG